jgi:hypothetical protein
MVLVGWLKAGPPTVADVGDVDSFGRNVIFLGASSGFITLSPSCTPAPSPTPSDQCVTLNPAPALTTYSLPEICRIKLPKDSAHSVIYPVLTFFQNYQLQNTTGGPLANALFDYSATLTIASDVLLDPTIMDPITMAPANGKLTFVFSPDRYRDDRTMNVGDRYRNRLTFTRAGNAGISKANLIGSGLTQKQADDLFKSSITVTMDVVGSAMLVTDAFITCNMRLMGDH